MIQKTKKQILGSQAPHGQTAMWLANNPASDKLPQKHPIQIGSTKFIDNQLKMLKAGNNNGSNTNTARGNKKHAIGLSPKAQAEGKGKDQLIEGLRKKQGNEHQRAYETVPASSNMSGL